MGDCRADVQSRQLQHRIRGKFLSTRAGKEQWRYRKISHDLRGREQREREGRSIS